jgi:hypothetical protein
MGTMFIRDDDEKEGDLHFRPGFLKDSKKIDDEEPDDEYRVNTRKSNDDDTLNLDDMLEDADAQAHELDDGEITNN